MKRVYLLLFALGSFCLDNLRSQQVIQHHFSLEWTPGQLSFTGASQSSKDPAIPVYVFRFPLTNYSSLAPSIAVESSEAVDLTLFGIKTNLPAVYDLKSVVEQERGKWYGRVWIVPIINEGSKGTRILTGTISVAIKPLALPGRHRSGPDYKENSILAQGIIHRIAVPREGIYKIDFNFIKDKLKIDPGTLNPNQIAMFGNGDGRIPQWNGTPRIDDLEETPMMGVGLQDGKFDQGDYFLWYAQGPDQWIYDESEKIYHMTKNTYDEVNHYYIIINGPTRSNLMERANGSVSDYVSGSSISYQRLEENKVNLLGKFRPPGSGQEWYGDELSVLDELDYTNRFDLSHLVEGDSFYFKVRFAVRAENLSRFYIDFDNNEFSRNAGGVELGNFEASFANDGFIQNVFKPKNTVQSIKVRYPQANGINSRAWIDYLELNVWRRNVHENGKPLFIRDPRSVYLGNAKYEITNFPANGIIWDITDPIKPVVQQYQSGTTSSFMVPNVEANVPNQFVAFNPEQDVLSPQYEGEIENQNLHAIHAADLLIIYYDGFESAASKLADHRSSYSHLNVVTVPVSQVIEEFGGGSKDPSAIRDFARMIYKRDPDFRYMLLLGDATYDYLHRTPELPDHNFIPAFETEESLYPVYSFPTDDYFGLLDDTEAEDGRTLKGAIDIAIGRLPADTPEDAAAMVDKIIYYDTNPATLSDWRERVVMVADDQDHNTHINQADQLAENNRLDHPQLNMIKIYLDAYPQVVTPGGDRYPAVNEEIDLNMKRGALTITYIGHGGPNGWAQERVLGINQAQSYENLDNMPLFITATCSFAGYDEPSFTSAGEHLLINPRGGAVGLMTTVRAVYSGSNERLTKAVLDRLYNPDSPGVYPTIGEVLRRSKNTGADSVDNNARKFTLLGDPSMNLAIPKLNVAVTAINNKPVDAGALDTLSALEKSTLTGVIRDDQGQIMSNFNGELTLTVFDKVQVRKTLANDVIGSDISIERTFNTQEKQLFKGKATVQGGYWTIEFVLPKDIDFAYGNGKLSFYAEDNMNDAWGAFTDFIIGGVSAEGLADDQAPVINLYMNDNQFVFGGITDANPYIYAELMDDFGINVSGTGVGHDIEAILDGDDKNSFILNDFYEASLDNYKKGSVRFPLTDLAPGKHTLKLTAWDLANNPGEAYLEFLVLDDSGPVLVHVLNYPNPFTNLTHFQFEHNRPGVPMDLMVQIFTINGRLIKTIEREDFVSDGYRVDDIEWDGLDDSGGQLAKGVYVYKIKATFDVNGTKEVAEGKTGKLVILR
jgi:hypothetical protein